MEIDDLNHHISALGKRAEKDKECLRKACKAQKLRAEKFEAAIEKCYDELKDKVRWLAISVYMSLTLCVIHPFSCSGHRTFN